MNCPACGHGNRSSARFCEECGERFEAACGSCGTELRAGAKFCDACGSPAGSVRPAEAPADSPSAGRSPLDYTPKHLAEKILQSKSAVEGERKQVTVLFADVKGSMELANQLGAERWHRVLDQFFQILGAGIHRFEGTVNQYTGDGIMALFGAPIAHEDHAHRAAYASLELRDELREFAHDVKRQGGLDFAVRIGIHSGDVIVGKIGDDLRMDYTAQGHTVGLAQRMEALASGGSIYLTEATAGLIRSYFELEDLGEFELKGAPDPVRAFELRGIGSARTRFDVSRARGLTRFVGRRDETGLLEAALEQGLKGPGRVVGVSAQAGTGKSRLCYEFLEDCRSRGVTVFEGRGLAHGRNIPLLPMLEMFRDFFGIEERDSDQVAREKVAGRVLLLDATLQDELPIFWELLGIPDASRPLPDVDPTLLQRRMYAALRAVVRADCDRDPGVVLIEDLHWLDPASDAMLEHVVDAVAGSRSLLLVNFRPEYRGRWMQQSYYQQLSLMPLSEEALRDLLRDLLGSHESVSALPEAIYARTGGNPFYIEELVQSLVEDQHLTGRRGSYRLVTEVGRLPMPGSVQALLAARIDRLPEREKRVLQTASVIGKNFGESILGHVMELPAEELSDSLRKLQDGEFLYESALYPEHEYSFKHPLTQEVAEGSQLEQHRMRAHAKVAEAYEALYGEHLDEYAALLAHHWESAGQATRAARWHVRAAERIQTTDFRETVAHWRRVDALLPEEGGDAEGDALKARVFGELLLRGFRTGISAEEGEELLTRARAFHGRRKDEASLGRCIAAYSAILQSAGRVREYRELIGELREAAGRAGDRELQISSGLDRIYSLTLAGQLEEAVAASEKVIELAAGDASLGASEMGYSPLAMCTAFAAQPLVALGRFEEAQRRLEQGRSLVGEHDSAETTTWMGFMECQIHLARGDTRSAIRAAQQASKSADHSGSVFDAVATAAWLAMTYAQVELWEDAEREMSTAIERSDGRIGLDAILSSSWAHAAAALGLGNVDEARARVNRSIADCREQEALLALAQNLCVRASICRADPGASEAEATAALDEAERVAREIGAQIVLGQILEARNLPREALEHYEALDAVGHAARVREGLGR